MKLYEFSKSVIACAVLSSMSTPGHVLAAGQTGLTLEEIVVTAQRREQTVQSVPISIAAVTGEEISELGLKNLDDLIEHIPGVELYDERGAGMPIWVIRSVALSDFNANNSPAAAIYNDEFYLSSNVLNGIGLYDIDRVEVLRGPQQTPSSQIFHQSPHSHSPGVTLVTETNGIF